MGWSLGYDRNLKRDIGYGVPAICDDPECKNEIDRGLSYACGGAPFGGDCGCGRHFCGSHLWLNDEAIQVCHCCLYGKPSYPPKPDTVEWLQHKLTDPSWEEWRQANPEETARMAEAVKPRPSSTNPIEE